MSDYEGFWWFKATPKAHTIKSLPHMREEADTFIVINANMQMPTQHPLGREDKYLVTFA